MRKYEITFQSVNDIFYSKPITVLVAEPDKIGPNTGAMLLSHGWGGNRYELPGFSEFSCDQFNLICLCAEYRQSGFDFDSVRGLGFDKPYDAGFYQVFDVLNALRTVLDLYPMINRGRLFHYGGSQGGYIALLSSIFAPQTFAFVYAASAITFLGPKYQNWAGREFAPYELSIRNVIEHADRIQCPLFLEHGTVDIDVPVDHTRLLAEKLSSLGKSFTVKYHEGGGHSLQPVTTRVDAFKATAPDYLKTQVRAGKDDFAAGTVVSIPCADRTLRIDWSKPKDSMDLFAWEKA
ncbi:MAG: prolyl oligopeptidase family serine peptidase [Phycisphaerae bacterium]